MKAKKLTALLMTAALVIGSFAACGSKEEAPKSEAPAASEASATEEAAPASSAAEEAEALSADGVDYTQGDPLNIKISTLLTEASISGQAIQKLADDLSEKSGGRVTCDIYFNGVLADWNTCFEMLCNGEIQLSTENPLAYETQITELATLDEYFMFDDLAHAHRFFEGEGGAYLNKAWNKVGAQGLCPLGLGFRELSNNTREVKTIEDMKGLTLRGYSTIQIDAWNAAGAAPTSVDWNELFVSMQQGLLDGQESALSTINDFSFYEVQKYVTLTDHVYTLDWLVTNQEWYEGLNDVDRQLFDECVASTYEWHKEAYQADIQNLMDKFTNEYDMTITELDPEVKTQLREMMAPVTVESVKQMAGEDVYNTVHEYVEAAR